MSLIPFNFDPDAEGVERYLQDDNHLPVNYEGRHNNFNYCYCRYCSSMLNDMECLCCNELQNLEQMRGEKQCITLHQSFSKLILDKEILNIAI